MVEWIYIGLEYKSCLGSNRLSYSNVSCLLQMGLYDKNLSWWLGGTYKTWLVEQDFPRECTVDQTIKKTNLTVKKKKMYGRSEGDFLLSYFPLHPLAIW